MKKWIAVLSVSLGLIIGTVWVVSGCVNQSQQRQVVNTLFTTGQTVDAAYRAYLDSIISGVTPTNSLPRISKQYADFQTIFASAIAVAALSSNVPPSPEVLNASSQLILSINAAKQR
jgi:hypothetical protein